MRKRHGIALVLALGAVACGPADEDANEGARAHLPKPNTVVLEDWACSRGQANLTGLAGGELPEEPHLLWSNDTGAPVGSSPVIAGGRVFVGNADGEVHAIFLESGERAWSVRPAGEERAPAINAPPLVAEGRLWVGDEYGTLWCLDVDEGAVQWSFETEGEISGAVNRAGAGEDALLLVGSQDCRLYGLDASGAERWRYECDNFIYGAPAVADGKAVFGGCDALLHVVSIANGTATTTCEVGSFVGASAAVVGTRAYVGHYDGRVLCIDLETGGRVWEYGTGELGFVSSPAVDETHVVIGSRDKRVHGIDRETGAPLWTFRTGGAVDASPVICGARVVAASEDGRVYVLDLETGERVWSYEVGAPILASPAVAGGRIVVGAEDGVVYAFGPR